jgi:hypothetical protein
MCNNNKNNEREERRRINEGWDSGRYMKRGMQKK